MLFCTSICANYLPKARCLAYSVKQHMPDSRFVLCLLEEQIPEGVEKYEYFDDIVLAKDMGWENFNRLMFKHAIVEGATSVKGQLFNYLLKEYSSEDKFIYLDPDVYVYSKFIELEELLDTHSIVVAPHLLFPGNIQMEISSLAHGCYNLGFLAVRRSENAKNFIQWWADRLFDFCYDDIKRGIFTDQRWIDLAPCFFDVFVLKHHGYDFATWSLLNAKMQNIDGNYYVNGDPLRFIHFSGFDGGTIDWAIEQWAIGSCKEIFRDLYEEYKKFQQENNRDNMSSFKWSYDFYSNGEKISNKARLVFRDNLEKCPVENPFALDDAKILRYGKTKFHRKIKNILKFIKGEFQ